MNKDNCAINFTGLTHDHTIIHSNHAGPNEQGQLADSQPRPPPSLANDFCSAISILKRHPMYDCLILVKKYRNCLGGYSLEFPIDRVGENERLPTNESAKHQHRRQAVVMSQQPDERPMGEQCGLQQQQQLVRHSNSCACSQQRLVSRFLDGDDPMYRASCCLRSHSDVDIATLNRQPENQENDIESTQAVEVRGTRVPFMLQIDDRGEKCDLVHVPVNGLLDRLENYTRNGVAVDSRVYAFAMGLKTAERMMTTKSMKELQETPI